MAGIPLTLPAIEKLLDYLAIGVGAIAGPLLAPWRASREGMARVIAAKADAEVRQIQAAAEGSTSQLIAKAQTEARGYAIPDEIEIEPDGSVRIGPDDVRKAIEFQATKRVANLRSIADHAAEMLGDMKVPDHDPDPDWTARFFDGAQEVSSGDLQKLWARILAGEVETPGRTSLRTLSILRNMTQQEARDFSTLMRFRIGNLLLAEGVQSVLENRAQRLMIHFSHLGLLGGWGEYQPVSLGDDGEWWVEHYGHALFIEGPPNKKLSGMEGNSVITIAGRELAALCEHEPHLAYLSHFAEFLKKQGCELKLARILARVDGGFESPKNALLNRRSTLKRPAKRKPAMLDSVESCRQSHMAIMRQITGDVRIGQPYPAYRDSGLDWLERVPEHWEMRPNKSMLSRRRVLVGEDHPEFDLLSLTKKGVIVRDLSTGQGKFSADPGTCQEVRVGDLVFCLFDVPETPRTVGLSDHHGMITGAYTILECPDSVLRRFLEAFYIAMDDRKLLAPLYSGLRNTIPPSSFLRAKTPVPPVLEQQAIVRYLDHADRRIRRYIRAKERQIELMEELKRTLIHEAVTGRIDVRTGQPYPAYKDSGVEWVGEVPEHWEVRPNKSMLSRRKVLVGEDHLQFDLLSLTKGGVIVRDLSTGQGKFSADPGTCQEVRVGDLVFCLFDVPETPRTVGLSAHNGMITGAYTILECPDSVLRRFLEGFYIAMDDRKLLAPLYSGLRNTIPPSSFLRAKTPVPPVLEQRAIARFLDRANRGIQRHVATTKRQIAPLHEYRTRLIADVVTGKLDVREAAANLPEAQPVTTENRSDTNHTESRSDATEHYMAKEAIT